MNERKSLAGRAFGALQKPTVTPPPRLGTAVVVGSASLVREVSPLLQPMGRVRWCGELSASECVIRSLADGFWVCVVEHVDGEDLRPRLDVLAAVAQRYPNVLRTIVVTRADLQLVTRCTESNLAHQIIYRPVDAGQVQTLVRRATNRAAA